MQGTGRQADDERKHRKRYQRDAAQDRRQNAGRDAVGIPLHLFVQLLGIVAAQPDADGNDPDGRRQQKQKGSPHSQVWRRRGDGGIAQKANGQHKQQAARQIGAAEQAVTFVVQKLVKAVKVRQDAGVRPLPGGNGGELRRNAPALLLWGRGGGRLRCGRCRAYRGNGRLLCRRGGGSGSVCRCGGRLRGFRLGGGCRGGRLLCRHGRSLRRCGLGSIQRRRAAAGAEPGGIFQLGAAVVTVFHKNSSYQIFVLPLLYKFPVDNRLTMPRPCPKTAGSGMAQRLQTPAKAVKVLIC